MCEEQRIEVRKPEVEFLLSTFSLCDPTHGINSLNSVSSSVKVRKYLPYKLYCFFVRMKWHSIQKVYGELWAPVQMYDDYFFMKEKTNPCSSGAVLSRSVVSDSLWPHGLWPASSTVHGDPPGKKNGEGCHFFLQGNFQTQGSNPGLPHCKWILYRLSKWILISVRESQEY